jgi:membrane protease YdiL (CAAX protease family)
MLFAFSFIKTKNILFPIALHTLWNFFGLLFVGITEEIVFRGFLLNTMLKRIKPWQAVLVDAALFTLIHYPIWVYYGFDIATILLSSVQIFPVSMLFAFSFIKTKNILFPIALHTLWNLFGLLFVG